ncbi:MAG: carboxypeptidase regulatory-like domain-containing protein, partial [Saprospiraceae bacterium]
MVRSLLLFSFFLLFVAGAAAQTSLSGKVTDKESKEPLIVATVALYKNGVLITGTDTDFDGNYNLGNLDPGTYEVEFSYTGYQPQRIIDVKVLGGKSNKVDAELETGGGITLTTVTVTTFKVPLIQQDNTTSGQTITSDQIKNLPTRNINALAALTAGLSSADEGSAVSVRGSRPDATNYYVDGIRIQGNLIPESEIDQLQVITGGVEAQYGDVTGGIISITTKGPASKFSGGVEAETSSFLDAFNQNLVGINLSGPIIKNKAGRSILGFRVAARGTYNEEDNPAATPIYRAKESKIAELEANPIILLGGDNLVAADFLKQGDVEAMDARMFEEVQRYDLTGKLDARISDAVDLSFTGAYVTTKDRFTPGGWALMNNHNNPYGLNNTYRGNFRLRHRLSGASSTSADGQARQTSTIQNASYTLQAGYEKTTFEDADVRHEDRLFDYGHVGVFDIRWVPTFAAEFNEETQQIDLNHTDYRPILRTYTNGTENPVLANYNNAMDINFSEGLNSFIGNAIITGSDEDDLILNRETFIAPNGAISSVFTGSWGFHTNVGAVYNRVLKQDNDIYSFNANASFDLVPGGSEKGRHSIQFGIWYEERANRSHAVFPRGLWDAARLRANDHIKGIEEGADSIGVIMVEGLGEAALLEQTISTNPDELFYKRVREALGVPLNQYVNVDGLDPSQLSLDMFSAKELNDRGLISYFGYDYLGNPFDGSFDDFFTATDAEGVRTFPVAPNRPIYTAGYIQDKFTFKDIIFRLGLRVDRYDANTRVLKDPYSLYEMMGADQYHTTFGGERPGNIGDDFKVYLNDETVTSGVSAYRDGDQWYLPSGAPSNNPALIFPSGLVFPKYQDERAQSVSNYIKERDFDTNVSFEDYEVQLSVMPRLAFSFPISTVANFFAHYDILVQRPPSNTIATARDYFYFVDDNSVKNNPNLKPERTIDYEVGFQQKLSESSALKIAAYYKELRDMIQSRTFFPVPIVTQYTTYDNQDFGTVKGFSFQYDLRRTGNFSLQANYTLQFADGTGSDANSQRNLSSRGNLRTL